MATASVMGSLHRGGRKHEPPRCQCVWTRLLEGPAGKKQSETSKKNKPKKNKPKKNLNIIFGGRVMEGRRRRIKRMVYSKQKFPGFVAGHW